MRDFQKRLTKLSNEYVLHIAQLIRKDVEQFISETNCAEPTLYWFQHEFLKWVWQNSKNLTQGHNLGIVPLMVGGKTRTRVEQVLNQKSDRYLFNSFNWKHSLTLFNSNEELVTMKTPVGGITASIFHKKFMPDVKFSNKKPALLHERTHCV
jgi:hypothetical protein